MVPLNECKIPTLMVLPLLAGEPGVVVGEAEAWGVAVGLGVLQAFRNKLDVRVAELYKRNFRRSNRLVIFFGYS
jgi:hypothetical protein